MGSERGAGGLAKTSYDVHDAIGNAGFLEQFTEPKCREWRLLGGFEHHRAAGRERRAKFPSRHEQREIPRDYLADDADRLAQSVTEKPRAGRVGNGNWKRVAVNFGRPPRHVAEQVDGERNVGHACDSERFAIVQGFEPGKLLQILLQQIGQLPNCPPAIGRRHSAPRPGLKGRARRLDRTVDVSLITGRDLANHIACGRIKSGKGFARSRLDPLAVDQHASRFARDALLDAMSAVAPDTIFPRRRKFCFHRSAQF